MSAAREPSPPTGPALPGQPSRPVMPSPCVVFQSRAHTRHGSAAKRNVGAYLQGKTKTWTKCEETPRCTEAGCQVQTPSGLLGSEEMSCRHQGPPPQHPRTWRWQWGAQPGCGGKGVGGKVKAA